MRRAAAAAAVTALSTLLPLSSPAALLTPASLTADLTDLARTSNQAATMLDASLNDTAATNTSAWVQGVTDRIGAAMARLGCDAVGHSTPAINLTSSDGDDGNKDDAAAAASFDEVYLDYADSLTELSHAVLSRGRIFHAEMNLPVVTALQGLASAVYYYGRCLRNGDFISQATTIRTWTAGSDIVQAETAWDKNLNYPGRRVLRPREVRHAL